MWAVAAPSSRAASLKSSPAVGGPERDPPGVLDSREEPLGERQVSANPFAGLRVGPLAGDVADGVRDLGGPRLGERGLDDDVGVLARGAAPGTP